LVIELAISAFSYHRFAVSSSFSRIMSPGDACESSSRTDHQFAVSKVSSPQHCIFPGYGGAFCKKEEDATKQEKAQGGRINPSKRLKLRFVIGDWVKGFLFNTAQRILINFYTRAPPMKIDRGPPQRMPYGQRHDDCSQTPDTQHQQGQRELGSLFVQIAYWITVDVMEVSYLVSPTHICTDIGHGHGPSPARMDNGGARLDLRLKPMKFRNIGNAVRGIQSQTDISQSSAPGNSNTERAWDASTSQARERDLRDLQILLFSTVDNISSSASSASSQLYSEKGKQQRTRPDDWKFVGGAKEDALVRPRLLAHFFFSVRSVPSVRDQIGTPHFRPIPITSTWCEGGGAGDGPQRTLSSNCFGSFNPSFAR
ncbi:hypothetical protein GX48_07701, partial [Paracoccidioides brasiliensis]